MKPASPPPAGRVRRRAGPPAPAARGIVPVDPVDDLDQATLPGGVPVDQVHLPADQPAAPVGGIGAHELDLVDVEGDPLVAPRLPEHAQAGGDRAAAGVLDQQEIPGADPWRAPAHEAADRAPELLGHAHLIGHAVDPLVEGHQPVDVLLAGGPQDQPLAERDLDSPERQRLTPASVLTCPPRASSLPRRLRAGKRCYPPLRNVVRLRGGVEVPTGGHSPQPPGRCSGLTL